MGKRDITVGSLKRVNPFFEKMIRSDVPDDTVILERRDEPAGRNAERKS